MLTTPLDETVQPDPKELIAQGYLRRLLTDGLRAQWKLYSVAIAAMVGVAAMTSVTAWMMRDIIDSMTMSENRNQVFYVAAAVAAVFIFKGIASYIQIVFLARGGNRIVATQQSRLYRKLLRQGTSFFNVTESSDLLMRITYSAQAARAVIDVIVTGFVRDLLTLIGLLIVMFIQQPILAFFCIFVIPITVLGVRFLLKRVADIMKKEVASLAEIIKVLQETSAGVRIVKAFALEGRMTGRMDRAIKDVEERANAIKRIEASTMPLTDTIAGLALAAVISLSVVSLFGSEATTPGQLISFVTALLMAYEPAQRLSRMRVSIEANMFLVSMMFNMLDMPETMVEHPKALPLKEGPGKVEFDKVNFAYGENKVVIKDLNVVFEPGKTTALVGPSGGGKSTILNLVMRMYDPTDGQVIVDGQDISKVTFETLRDKMAYVGQDTFLFSTSVMENIRFGRTDATDEEVIEAAKIAHADEFIRDLPKGYDTPVGENGAFLSGGQKQRIAIARAVLRKASILLLDEATSALDSHSELLVRDALGRITQGVTTIVIAHRLTTIMSADAVCYVEGGRIVEKGSIGDLRRSNGKFAALFDEHFRKGDDI